MYYVNETWIRIYLMRIEMGSWTPKEVVFLPPHLKDILDEWYGL